MLLHHRGHVATANPFRLHSDGEHYSTVEREFHAAWRKKDDKRDRIIRRPLPESRGLLFYGVIHPVGYYNLLADSDREFAPEVPFSPKSDAAKGSCASSSSSARICRRNRIDLPSTAWAAAAVST